MKTFAPAKKPTFFWQGVLILLPVIVLAAFGVYSLKIDRQKAEQEAIASAKSIAERVADAFEQELTNAPGSQAVVFETDLHGNLLDPPPWKAIPEPRPFDFAQLAPGLATLWHTAIRASQNPTSSAEAVKAWRAFLATKSPPDMEAAALYQLGMACKKAREQEREQAERAQKILPGGPLAVIHRPPPRICLSPEAAEAFAAIVARFPQTQMESGLPLAPLAQWRWLETADITPQARLAGLDSLVTNLLDNPSLLSAHLSQLLSPVRELEAECKPKDQPFRVFPYLYIMWGNREAARTLHSLLRQAYPVLANGQLATPRWLWLRDEDDEVRVPVHFSASTNGASSFMAGSSNSLWLVLSIQDKTNRLRFVCRNKDASVFLRPSDKLLEHAGLPDYAGFSFEIAGQPIGAPNGPFVFERPTQAPSRMKRARMVNIRNTLAEPTYLNSTQRAGEQSMPAAIPSDEVPGNRWIARMSSSSAPVLASARRTENGMEYLKVNVHLCNAPLLYRQVQSRTLWLGLLIGTAALAALVGWFTAWRAFHRQHQLAVLQTNFVSSVSHELRAPIASMRLLAERLERGKVQDPGRQKDYFRLIVQECRRLGSLVENVLDFSRIEQGRKQYEFEPTDLKALVQETVRLMTPSAEERHLHLECLLPEGAVSADVDGRAIQQALVNLIDNALKHSPDNAVVQAGLECLTQSPAAPSNLPVAHNPPLRLYVQDHGPGIPVEEQERIFERFYRRGSELRRETQGVGIGLSIVQHIVEAHGGRVWAQSEVGQGSRFIIELFRPRFEVEKQRAKL